MKWTSIFALCAVALFAGACEKHPLAGEPPVVERSEGGEAAKPESKEGPAEAPKPAEGAKAEESPKFFPEKK